MRTLLRTAAATLAVGGLLLATRPAAAISIGGYSDFHLDYPAASCYQAGALQIWNGALFNHTSSVQYVECPIVTDDYYGQASYVSAFSTGATNGVTCWLGEMHRNGSGGASFPTNRTYQSGYEAQNWSSPAYGAQVNVDLECALQPNTGFTGYTIGGYWASWQN
jgi:hypothetical protein